MRYAIDAYLRQLWVSPGRIGEVLRQLCPPGGGFSGILGSLRVAGTLYAKALGWTYPHLEGLSGRRTQTGHRPVCRSEGFDGVVGRSRSGGSAPTARRSPRALDG